MRRWQLNLVCGALSGVLLTAVFPQWGYAFLAPLALCPLLFGLAHEPDWRRRFGMGWIAGTLFFGFSCYWIQAVLAEFGGLSVPLSWLALFLFAIAKGLHVAVFAALAGLVIHRAWAVPAIAALWAGIERTHGPLGFAWLQLGNAGIDMGLPLRLAPFTGVYGISWVFAAMAVSLTLIALRRGRKHILWLAPCLVVFALPPVERDIRATQSAVTLQPVVDDRTSWTQPLLKEKLRDYGLATLQAALDVQQRKPALVLWPEMPGPFYFYEDTTFRDQVTQIARLAGAPFLFSSVARTPEMKPLNSAVMLSASGQPVERYDKMFLVPFGEFVPPLFGWVGKVSDEAGNFERGTRLIVFTASEHNVGAFICYESAFPHLVRRFTAKGAEVLVNLTNDGYFGSSAARHQHLYLARMRAVENRRWLLRSTNDGITAGIDPAGRVYDRLEPGKQLAGRLRFDWLKEQTAYTRFGDWFAWLCLAAGLAACIAAEVPIYRG